MRPFYKDSSFDDQLLHGTDLQSKCNLCTDNLILVGFDLGFRRFGPFDFHIGQCRFPLHLSTK